MIYQAAHPLAAQEMLTDLELKVSGTPEAQLFALNYALSKDARFDNVSLTDEPVWYLRALEPAAVFACPSVLTPAFRAVGGEWLGLTMLDLVDQIGDELDIVETATTPNDIHMELSFPHLYAGTLPLGPQIRRILPATRASHIALTLVDARDSKRFEVWAVPAQGYICGLDEWYQGLGMSVGGQVSLAPSLEPLTFTITATPIRQKKSEWIHAATVEDGNLRLQQLRSTVTVRCDKDMLIQVPSADVIAEYMRRAEQGQMALNTIVFRAMEALSGISKGGLVHAKSIYSAANLMRRTGAVAIFSELTQRACYDPVGAGLWAVDPALQSVVYQTPEEMMERPQSTRTDVIKDPVVQYGRR